MNIFTPHYDIVQFFIMYNNNKFHLQNVILFCTNKALFLYLFIDASSGG